MSETSIYLENPGTLESMEYTRVSFGNKESYTRREIQNRDYVAPIDNSIITGVYDLTIVGCTDAQISFFKTLMANYFGNPVKMVNYIKQRIHYGFITDYSITDNRKAQPYTYDFVDEFGELQVGYLPDNMWELAFNYSFYDSIPILVEDEDTSLPGGPTG